MTETHSQDQLPVTPECGMLERLGNRHIRVLQGGVFSDQDDGYRIEQTFLALRFPSIVAQTILNLKYLRLGQELPSLDQILPFFDESRWNCDAG